MANQASNDCQAACTAILLAVEQGRRLLVDDEGQILAEYLSVLRQSRTSGLASKLAAKLYRTRHGGATSVAVPITPIGQPPGSYSEVPDNLKTFDTDDQKFIAVAATTGGSSPVIAGLDGEWWDRRADFAAAGILVQYPCLVDLIAN